MTSLYERLTTAEKGSRALSDEVLLAFGYWIAETGWWRASDLEDWSSDRRPDPTRSVDDALALVPEGRSITLRIAPDGQTQADIWGLASDAATPPLAISAAAVKAEEQSHD